MTDIDMDGVIYDFVAQMTSYAERNGRLVIALEFDRDGETVHTMEFSEPCGEFSARLERLERGVLINMADDAIFFEIGEDGERLT